MADNGEDRVEGRFPIAARVSFDQRNKLKAFAAKSGDQMQTVIKKALNAYLLSHDEEAIFDESEGPQGAAAHRSRRADAAKPKTGNQK